MSFCQLPRRSRSESYPCGRATIQTTSGIDIHIEQADIRYDLNLYLIITVALLLVGFDYFDLFTPLLACNITLQRLILSRNPSSSHV